MIVGSLLLIVGRDTRIGAALLLVFLLPTTLIFHSSFDDPGLVRNVTLMGALLLAITRPVLSSEIAACAPRATCQTMVDLRCESGRIVPSELTFGINGSGRGLEMAKY